MKKNSFIVLVLVGIFGIAIFWSQQSEIESAKLNEEPIISITTKEVHDPSPLSEKIVVESNVEVKLETEVKRPITREEAFTAQRQAALEASGLLDKIQRQGGSQESESQRIRVEQDKRLSPNRRAKELLNIDVVKTFGVDLDAKREKIRTRMRVKNNTELEKRLVALGVAPDLRKELMENLDLGYENR